MGLKKLRSIRNEELIAATVSAIHQHGYANVTILQIAKQAGASAGSIGYYFGSKEKLFEGTMLSLLNILKMATVIRLSKAESAEDRLLAVLQANFDDTLFTKEHCSVWTQFWANARYEKSLARLHHINRSRVKSNLAAELRSLVPPEHRDTTRRTLQNYMDGVWIHAAQTTDPIDPADERDKVADVMRLVLDAAR